MALAGIRGLFIALAALVFDVANGRGQSLRPLPVTAAPGQAISVLISYEARPGDAPSTLKWETVFPAQLLEIDGSPEIGASAKGAGKSLICNQRQPYVYVCIIEGGRKAIEAGPIAVVHFRVRSDARHGSAIIGINHVDAVTQDLKPVELTGKDGRVDIQ